MQDLNSLEKVQIRWNAGKYEFIWTRDSLITREFSNFARIMWECSNAIVRIRSHAESLTAQERQMVLN